VRKKKRENKIRLKNKEGEMHHLLMKKRESLLKLQSLIRLSRLKL
jgi:hypothetical protein